MDVHGLCWRTFQLASLDCFSAGGDTDQGWRPKRCPHPDAVKSHRAHRCHSGRAPRPSDFERHSRARAFAAPQVLLHQRQEPVDWQLCQCLALLLKVGRQRIEESPSTEMRVVCMLVQDDREELKPPQAAASLDSTFRRCPTCWEIATHRTGPAAWNYHSFHRREGSGAAKAVLTGLYCDIEPMSEPQQSSHASKKMRRCRSLALSLGQWRTTTPMRKSWVSSIRTPRTPQARKEGTIQSLRLATSLTNLRLQRPISPPFATFHLLPTSSLDLRASDVYDSHVIYGHERVQCNGTCPWHVPCILVSAASAWLQGGCGAAALACTWAASSGILGPLLVKFPHVRGLRWPQG